MKKQLVMILISLTLSPIRAILCMDQIIHHQIITSQTQLSQNDVNEQTKKLKKKYNNISDIQEFELLRKGIIDTSKVIAQAANKDIEEMLLLRKDLFEQYKSLGFYDKNYDYLYGIMNIKNRINLNETNDSDDRRKRKWLDQERLKNNLLIIKKLESKVNSLKLEYETLLRNNNSLAAQQIDAEIKDLELNKKAFFHSATALKKEIIINTLIQSIATLSTI